MTPNEIHGDMVHTLAEDFPYYSTVKNSQLHKNSSGAGIAQKSNLGQAVQNPQPLMNMLKTFTVWLLVTDVLLSRWLSPWALVLLRSVLFNWYFRAEQSCWLHDWPQECLKQSRRGKWLTLLTQFQADPKNFYRSLATQDKTRVHHIESKTRI